MKLVPLFPDPETLAARSRWRRRGRAGADRRRRPRSASPAVPCSRSASCGRRRGSRSAPSALARVRLRRFGESVCAERGSSTRPGTGSARRCGRARSSRPARWRPGRDSSSRQPSTGRSGSAGSSATRSRYGWSTQAPATSLTSRLVYPLAGRPVQVRFSAPVRVLSVTHPDGRHTQADARSGRAGSSRSASSPRARPPPERRSSRPPRAGGSSCPSRSASAGSRRGPTRRCSSGRRPSIADRPLRPDRAHLLAAGRGRPRRRAARREAEGRPEPGASRTTTRSSSIPPGSATRSAKPVHVVLPRGDRGRRRVRPVGACGRSAGAFPAARRPG